jgi:hypothetical protein
VSKGCGEILIRIREKNDDGKGGEWT